MPFTVGIDLVCTEEVQEALRRHGDRYLRRVYTDEERAESGLDPLRLAARFAAKEATIKALRGGDEPLDWRAISVHEDEWGRASIRLTGAAHRLARRAHVKALRVSLTHRRRLAGAVVLAEMGTEP
jgi:holo-[acyl-carrier protein] synthase